jgi:hypothetical protein
MVPTFRAFFCVAPAMSLTRTDSAAHFGSSGDQLSVEQPRIGGCAPPDRPDWIKVKNRSHPALERVKESFS